MNENGRLERDAAGALILRRALDEVSTAADRSDAALLRMSAGGLVAADRQAGSVSRSFQQVSSASRSVEQALGRAFSGALRDGAELDKVLKRLAFDMGKLAVQEVVRPSNGGVTGGAGGFGGLLGGLFGGLFGARASGGPVAASRPYLVGERGPEMFVPDRAGRVVAQSGVSGNDSGPVAVNITINSPDVEGFRASGGQVRGQIADAVRAGMRRR